MLDSRKGAILRAIVREYVRVGQPVGSKALSESYGLAVSAATVRNDMALLEDLGYIKRPHASAGGVPTDQGYRWFIDNWPGPAWPELPRGQQLAIRGAFQRGFHALEAAPRRRDPADRGRRHLGADLPGRHRQHPHPGEVLRPRDRLRRRRRAGAAHGPRGPARGGPGADERGRDPARPDRPGAPHRAD